LCPPSVQILAGKECDHVSQAGKKRSTTDAVSSDLVEGKASQGNYGDWFAVVHADDDYEYDDEGRALDVSINVVTLHVGSAPCRPNEELIRLGPLDSYPLMLLICWALNLYNCISIGVLKQVSP
jgi:hypothetical protein